MIILFKFFDKIKKIYNCYRFKFYTKNKNKVICYGNINLINSNIKIGENVVIYPNVSFEGNGLIEIRNNVKIGTNTILYANKDGGGIQIGDNTIIAANNYIIDSNHNMLKDKNIFEQPLKSKKSL